MRRSRGAGSVRYNAPRGRYEAVLVVGGTKHTRTVPSPEPNERRKKEAEAVLAKLVARYGMRDPRNLTVAGYFEEWLAHMEPPRVAWLTWRTHRSRADRHIIPALGKIPLEGLTTRRIDALLTNLSRKLSPVTVQHVRKTLHAAMAQAEVWELIPRNPVSLVKAPRTPNVERKTLSPEQAVAFLEHVRGDRLEALWSITASLGLRSGEVRGLTWEAVGLMDSLTRSPGATRPSPRTPSPASDPRSASILRVEQALGYQPPRTPSPTRSRGGGSWELHEPKTPKSRRTITLPDYIAEQLERRRVAQRFEERTLGYSNPMGLVFTTPDGYPLSSQWLTTRLQALLEEAGLPRVTVHDLRHLAASLLLAKGVGVRAVQDILGHATAAMTLNIYAASDDAQRRDAADRLEAWRAQ